MINRFRKDVTLGVAASACLALVALAPLAQDNAQAQAISKTITIVVPYSAGGDTVSVPPPAEYGTTIVIVLEIACAWALSCVSGASATRARHALAATPSVTSLRNRLIMVPPQIV